MILRFRIIGLLLVLSFGQVSLAWSRVTSTGRIDRCA